MVDSFTHKVSSMGSSHHKLLARLDLMATTLVNCFTDKVSK